MLLICILQKIHSQPLVSALLVSLALVQPAHADTALADQATQGPGIIQEDISTSERHARPLGSLNSSIPYQIQTPGSSNVRVPRTHPDQESESENLLEHMDVYALSPHAHLLAMPRMVSPYIVMEAARGRCQLPTQAQWKPIIEESSKISGLDAKLIAAVIHVESRNNPEAISPKGAQGLMQLMPDTQAHLGVTDPFDPRANVRAGSLYLKQQLDTFDSLELALAAYNAGPGNVVKYNGIPPFAETKNFVRRVLTLYQGKNMTQ
ncbi:hypothetical protein MASR1M90_07780 [Desulfovibrionales bacterium]